MPEETPQLSVSETAARPVFGESKQEVQIEVPSLIDKLKLQKKKILIGLGVFFGVLVLGGAVFGIYKYAQRQIPFEPSEGPTPEIATPTPDPTADWETFTSSYGYSIRLSPEMKVGETGMGRGKPEDAEGIRIYPSGASEPLQVPHMDLIVISNSQLSLEQAAEDNYSKNINHKGIPATSVEKVHEGSFLGGSSYEYTLRNKGLVTPHEEYIGYEGEYKVIWTEKNSKLFAIFFTKTSQFNLILSTFKFLEEKGMGEYQIFGDFTKAASQEDTELLRKEISQYSDSINIMESFPMQFQIIASDKNSCEEIRKILPGFKFISSFGECIKRETPVNPEEPVESPVSPGE